VNFFVVVVEDDWRLPLPTTLVHASRPPFSNFGPAFDPDPPEKSYWLRALNRPDTALSSWVFGLPKTRSEFWS
jgi:hypothetical protein